MVKPKFKKLIRKTKGKTGPKVSGTKSLINNYFTRAQALRKLQITLKAFRRLCILKGIYPREPSKNLKANKQKTYYHAKDIMFLLHDPLLETFRQIQTYKKKVVKAKARGETTRLAMLMENRPRYPLEHILKQRYPTFLDALKELDDALSMVFLFAQFPQTQKIKLERVEHCQKLCFEFMNYIVFTRSLEKAFLSVRGIYYQVIINGQPIVWLTPYYFTQKLPKKVDYRVMLAFLDLYEQLVSFSLFKLYHDVGLAYPPLLDKKKDEDCEGLSSFRLITLTDASKDTTTDESSKPKAAKPKKQGQKLPKELSKKLQQIEQTEADQEAEAADTEPALESDMFDKKKRLFQNLHFFLDRETPLLALEFIIRSFGGKVSFHDRSDPSITHHVVDRPFIKEKVLGRTYIQPQYVFDCINAGIMLPTHEYLPGVTLPPHLSPFVDDDKEGYIPDRKAEIQRLVDKAQGFAAEYGNALDLTDFQDLTGDQDNEEATEAPQDEEEIDMNEEEEVGEDGEVVIKRAAVPQEGEGEGDDKPLSNRALKKKKQQRKESKKLAKLMSKTPEERQQMEETELKKSLLSSTKRKLYDKLTSQDKRHEKKNKILQDRKERIQKRKQKESQQQDTNNTGTGQSATNKKRKVAQ